MHQPPTKFEVSRRHTFGFNINRPVTLTFDLLTSNLVHIIACRVGNLHINFVIYGTLRSWLMGQHLTLRPWPLTLEFMALVGDTGLRSPSVYQVGFVGLSIQKIWRTSGLNISRINTSVSLVYQTHHVTLRPWRLTLEVTAVMRVFVFLLCTEF